jgi:2-keto-4-pentenoate hydratase/2-oxohepta-3-ene-1,7-dioic acid hydratase in catechol pathway
MKISTILLNGKKEICLSLDAHLYKVNSLNDFTLSGKKKSKKYLNNQNFLNSDNYEYALNTAAEYLDWKITSGEEEVIESKVTDDSYSYLSPIASPPLLYGVIQNAPEFWRRNNRNRIDTGFVSGFARANGARSGHLSQIDIPSYTTSFRCAAELGVVIGKDAKNVTEDRAMEYVFGYTCVNDMIGNCWSSFANQRNSNNNPSRFELLVNSYYGRNTCNFGPVGPSVVTKDEINDPYNLLMYTRFNGMQNDRSFSNAMLVGIERCISILSSFITLRAGSIIHMGSMGLDGIPIDDDRRLLDTDFVEIEIEKIGKLRNYFNDRRNIISGKL